MIGAIALVTSTMLLTKGKHRETGIALGLGGLLSLLFASRKGSGVAPDRQAGPPPSTPTQDDVEEMDEALDEALKDAKEAIAESRAARAPPVEHSDSERGSVARERLRKLRGKSP